MKRWIFFVLAILIFAFGIYLYIPFFKFDTMEQLLKFVLLMGSFILVFITVYITFHLRERQKVKTLQNRLSMWTKLSYHVNQVGDEVFNELPIGIIAMDDEYEIKWANPHAKSIFDPKITGKDLEDVHLELHKNIMDNMLSFTIVVKQETYDVLYRPEYKFFYLFNITEREKIKLQYHNRIPVLGIIYLDNFDESLSQFDVSEQSSLKGEYLAAIADWANQYDGFLKPYSDERLLVVLYREQLMRMIQDKFDILDKIRLISTQNKTRVSISMGVASWDIDYEDLGIYAQNAVELAEKRGGDQVVVNIQDQKIQYFGAKNDASAKSSKVGVRINAQTIADLFERSSSVFVMGHMHADLDVFASLLAVYHLGKASKKPTFMIMDEDKLDPTTKKVYDIVINQDPSIKERIISSDIAYRQIMPESMLVVVDSQSPKIVMSPNVLEKANKVMVIDHHRIGEETFNAMFSINEPYASSTIELLADIMSFYTPLEDFNITPLEASVMYGGLIVDTNNFSYRTSARTFDVAAQLRDMGADITEVKLWLRRDLMRTMEINQLLSQVEIYLDRFAFIVTPEVYEDRVLLAQVADAALMISGIDASFVIARTDQETVSVSARSYQQVNAQVIMEAIGGGGHLNSAAAQIHQTSIHEVHDELKKILDLEYGGEGETMKIILLEDVKGRGKKDDILDVAAGFGQYLITQKKALMASDENLEVLKQQKEEEQREIERHLELMRKLKAEIDGKKITLGIQIGQDGKLFGHVTTKQIVEQFEQDHHILIDKKKVELSSDINSVGIYTASVQLHKDIKAQFEVHIIEK